MKNTSAVIVLALIVLSGFSQQPPDKAMAEAKAVLSKMTLEEKISLCAGISTMSLNPIPRVGINKEFYFDDSSCNVRAELDRMTFAAATKPDDPSDQSTSMPTLEVLASTWDRSLASAYGHMIGTELRARNKDMILGPGVNIMRTPLCGRNFEYLTEDPALGAALVVEYIKAVQSHDVSACVKHFAANSQEWNRNTVIATVDARTLHEIYLPIFRAAVKDAGVLAVMNAYNLLAVPGICEAQFCSQNAYLNRDVLRKAWGFKGLVVTDWGSVHDTVEGANGGTDIEMNAGNQIRVFKPEPLLKAMKDGKVTEATVNDMVLHTLYVMAKVGFFDGRTRDAGSINTKEHQALARRVAEEGTVLLKNDKGVLPLDPNGVKKVVVMGQGAVTKYCNGGWSAEGKPPYEVVPLEGITNRLGSKVSVVYMPLTLDDQNSKLAALPEAAINTFDTDVKDQGMTVRAWRASYFANKDLSGAPAAAGFQRGLNVDWKMNAPVKEVQPNNFSVRWEAKVVAPETGTYVLGARANAKAGTRILVDGKLVMDNWTCRFPTATGYGEIALSAKQEYAVTVEYTLGESESTCFFGWRLPSEKGISLSEMESVVRKADAVVVLTGTGHGHGRALECEGADRPNLLLPPGHDEAIAKVLAWSPKAVIVNHSGSPMELPWISKAATLIQYGYAGMEGGNALAALLFGDVNPSGKLPHTCPFRLADTPAALLGNYNGTNSVYHEGIFIGYRWYDKKAIEPMFPFGHGLSYTTFKYGKVTASAKKLAPGGECTVSVNVTNTGKRAGKEIVQLYVRDLAKAPKVEREIRALKNFAKVELKPGESKVVTLTVKPSDLTYYDVAAKNFRADAGTYAVEVGASSRDIKGKAEIALTSDYTEAD
jgi:beta-glucosidase